MEKSIIIQDYCTDILNYSWINEEMSGNLLVAAGLVEDDITHAGCDVLGWSSRKAAEYVRENILFCSRQVQDDAYFLLMSCNTVH